MTLTQEYERLHEVFGWNKEHFYRCNLNALHAAFVPEETKQRLEQRLRVGCGTTISTSASSSTSRWEVDTISQ